MKNILYFLLLFLFQNLNAQNNLIPFRKDSLWGFANENKKIVIPCQYQEVFPFQEGLALVAKTSTDNYGFKYGFIDKNGKTVIPFDYHWGHSFKDGFAYVEQYNDKGNFWGVINKKNKAIIPIENMCAPIPIPVIEDMSFNQGLMSLMRITGSYGYEMGVRDDKGKIIIPFGKFEYIGKFSEGLADFKNSYDGNSGYINDKGKVVIKPAYYTASEFSEGLARVRTSNLDQEDFLMGFIDKAGKMIIPMEYYSFANFSEGLVPVAHRSNPEKEGCIDKNGKTIIPFEYDRIAGFQNGISAAVKNGKLGYINTKNEIIIPFEYDYTKDSELSYHNFYEGKAAVIKNGKYGFINTKGDIVIDFKYFAVGDLFWSFPYFKNGVVKVKKTEESLSFYIDAKGVEYVEE